MAEDGVISYSRRCERRETDRVERENAKDVRYREGEEEKIETPVPFVLE